MGLADTLYHSPMRVQVMKFEKSENLSRIWQNKMRKSVNVQESVVNPDVRVYLRILIVSHFNDV
jgi:hypothetical protein